jgi:hypothetical protein
MEKLTIFVNRLSALDIKIELVNNYPWIYLHKINDKLVTEKFHAKHGFTIGFLPIQRDNEFQFTELSNIFKLIRKYL